MVLRLSVWIITLMALTVALISPVSAQQATEAASSGQVLAIATTPRLDPAPTEQDFLNAFKLVHDAGTDGDVFSAKWNELEDAGGKYKFDDYLNGMAGYEMVYPDTLEFSIQVINTTAKETPPDLMNMPFDDPKMLQRFDALIDAALPKFGKYVRYLAIGNEVDSYLATHNEWAAYKTFYDGVVAHMHQVAPNIKVGVTMTYNDAIMHPDEVKALNEKSGVFILTYYPLDNFFMANNPAAPLQDFPKMVEMAGGLPVVLQEVGYPSSSLLDSSEAEQSEFVKNVFTAWKAEGGAIPFLSYFLLHDLTDDICSSLEGYYGVKAANFHAYLCSIGLRQSDGTPKLGWQTFVDQAQAWRKGA